MMANIPTSQSLRLMNMPERTTQHRPRSGSERKKNCDVLKHEQWSLLQIWRGGQPVLYETVTRKIHPVWGGRNLTCKTPHARCCGKVVRSRYATGRNNEDAVVM